MPRNNGRERKLQRQLGANIRKAKADPDPDPVEWVDPVEELLLAIFGKDDFHYYKGHAYYRERHSKFCQCHLEKALRKQAQKNV